MTDRSRLLLLFSVMAAVAILVAGLSLLVLYDATVERERGRLMDLAEHQRDMIMSHLAPDHLRDHGHRPDTHHAEGEIGGILAAITHMHMPKMKMGEAGAFMIGWRTNGTIAFHVPPGDRHGKAKPLMPVPFDSELAEPMRRALQGQSGTLIGRDYAGDQVLAAYLPLPGTAFGIVAKIDMADIRAPFIRADVITGSGAVVILLLAMVVVRRISTPLVQRLERSVRSLANAQRIAQVGNWERNLGTGEVQWSDEMFHIFGVARCNFTPTIDSVLDHIHREDRENVRGAIMRTADSGAPLSAYARVVRPDGEERFVLIIGERIDGGPDGPRTAGTVQDISDWKRAVEALEDSEERFRAVIEHAPDAITIKGTDGRYTVANRLYCRWFNADPEDIIGKTIHDLFDAELAANITAQDHEVSTKGTVITVEREVSHPDGVTRFLRVNKFPIFDAGGECAAIGTIINDITESKQAELALRQSEALFRAVVNHSPTKIHIKDKDGRYLLINTLAGKLFGISNEEGRGKLTHDLFPKEVADAFVDHDRKVMAGGKPVEMEEEFTLEDGVHTYLTVKFPIYDGDTVTGVGAIGTDITEHKKTREELIRSEQRLRGAIESLQEGFALFDAEDRLIACNDVYRSLYHDADRVLGSNVTFAEIIRERVEAGLILDAVGREEEFIRERLERHRNPAGPIVQANKDGNIYLIQEARTPEGGIATTLVDITELKHAQAKLAENETRFRAVIENLPSYFSLKDLDGRFLLVNQEHTRIYGTSADTGTGREFMDTLPPEINDQIVSQDQETIESESVVTWERTMELNGEPRTFLVTTFPIIDADGNFSTLGTLGTDITALKQTESQLMQSAKLATLGQMASGIAHELNQPLNIIRMAAESALIRIDEGALDAGTQEKKLIQIEGQAARMAQIIDHMRVFAREDKSDTDGTFAPSACVENALTLLEQQFTAAGIGLVKKLSGVRGLVRGTSVQLEQVVMNLLSNARQAVTARMETQAAAGRKFEGRITVDIEENASDKTLTIAIIDNGGGIPPEVRAHIFDPFYTTKTEGEGTGLGLSISYKIIEGMGGWLDAVDVDGGTRFEITLPRIPPTETGKKKARKRKKARANGDNGNDRRILVVDDEVMAVEGLAEYLERKGFDVATANDGNEALAEFGKRAADVVITDLRMPGMDGHELIRRLRETHPDLPILVTTGHTTVGDDEEVVAEGATCIIKKPISLREIMDRLDGTLRHGEGNAG